MKLITITLSILGVLLIGSGCGAQSPPTSPSGTSSVAESSQASTTVSQFDPQWMTLGAPSFWMESRRRITAEFQQFGLRPVDETELPRNCNGCGVRPPTAYLTAYTVGNFDPTEAQLGEPVTVTADKDGFFSATQSPGDAMLAWQYADNAWATVRGETALASDRDRMLELARALRPMDLTEIRLPLSMPTVPESMPLAEIAIDRGDYGTTIHFASCGADDVGGIPDCYGKTDNLRVQIWPTEEYSGHIDEQNSAPTQVGGREGLYQSDGRRAAVPIQPGILVVFDLGGPSGIPPAPPQANLKEILATVAWAANPGEEQTWRPIAQWARSS